MQKFTKPLTFKSVRISDLSRPHETGGICVRGDLEDAIKSTRDYLGPGDYLRPALDFAVFEKIGSGDNPYSWILVYDSRKDKKMGLEEREEDVSNKILYEIKDVLTNSVHYGYKLAVNSTGQWVMELKGSGDV